MDPYAPPRADQELQDARAALPYEDRYVTPGWRSTATCIAFAVIGTMRVVSAALLSIHDRDMRVAGAVIREVEGSLVWLATIVFVMWVHRIVSNATVFRRGDFSFTTSSAIWWWFVPVASIVQGYRIVSDAWRASSPEDARDPSWPWRTNPSSPIVTIWWLAWIGAGVVTFFETISESRTFTASAALIGLATVTGILMIRRLDAMQRQFADTVATPMRKKKKKRRKKAVDEPNVSPP